MMKNFSDDDTPVFLEVGKQYIIIDALYWMDVVAAKDRLDTAHLIREMRKEVFKFPLTNTPFAEFEARKDTFTISQLTKVFEGEAVGAEVLDTDTALLLVANVDILGILLTEFSCDDLLDHSTATFNAAYWDRLIEKFPQHSLALLSTPGISKGVDFDGSGRYRVVY